MKKFLIAVFIFSASNVNALELRLFNKLEEKNQTIYLYGLIEMINVIDAYNQAYEKELNVCMPNNARVSPKWVREHVLPVLKEDEEIPWGLLLTMRQAWPCD